MHYNCQVSRHAAEHGTLSLVLLKSTNLGVNSPARGKFTYSTVFGNAGGYMLSTTCVHYLPPKAVLMVLLG